MKPQLRKQIHAALAAIPPDEARYRGEIAARRVTLLPEFAAARVVMIYLTIAGEIDTQPIAHAAFAAGKVVVAPMACPDTKQMLPAICPPGDEDLFHPNHGLRQPIGPAEPVEEIDLVIVPALAFDRSGHRLGRGGGFYDRFLARPELEAKTIGLAFAEQIVPNVPIQPLDLPVDVVVTDVDIFRVA